MWLIGKKWQKDLRKQNKASLNLVSQTCNIPVLKTVPLAVFNFLNLKYVRSHP